MRTGILITLLAMVALMTIAGLAARAQQQPLPQINATGQIGPKPPVGSGGCSITAPTCADVAPAIIHSALGRSPLRHNVRLLTAMIGGKENRAVSAESMDQWAVEAFRKAGADDVRVENYTPPAGMVSKSRGRKTGTSDAKNVVAEIRGRSQTNEFVILGAALNAPYSTAARVEAACNVALLVDAARAIQAAGVRPLRSIRFVLFGGAKQGLAGSRAYVRAHISEMDRTDAVIVYDAGDRPVTGYALEGRRGLEASLRQALVPAAQFGAGHDTDRAELGTAAFRFLLEGVPALVTNPHGNLGSVSAVNLAALKRDVALAALTAYGIADLPERLGTRLAPSQVRRLLEQTGLESEMKTAGTWSRWEQGQDGRER